MRTTALVGAIALLPLLLGGCASSGPREERVDRLSLIEQNLARVIADLDELQEENRANRSEIVALRGELQEALAALRIDGARLGVQVDSLEAMLQAIGERVDDAELRIGNMRQEVRGLRYSRYGSAYPATEESEEAAEEEPAGESAEESEPAAESEPRGEAAAYRIAYADFLAGDYNLALSGLREFLRSFPESADADDAQFYVGECLYNLGDYEAAVEEYDAVILHYSDSQYRVSAMFKKALSFLSSNQTAQGVILLQQLIRRYPDTNEARMARERLRSLGLNP